MPRAKGIESKNQLLVEGNDQRNFFRAFVKHRSIENIQIQNFGGVNELSDFLLAFVKMPDFHTVQSIGIVRDAEMSAKGAFQSVRSSLKKVKLSIPQKSGVRTDANPAVTVLILPDENRRGMLETLICQSFADTSVDQCIDGFFTCVENSASVSIKNADKARVHAYLTTRPEPHYSVGVAAMNGYWDLDHEAFRNVHEFLQRIL